MKQNRLKLELYLIRFEFIKTGWIVVRIYHKLC